MLLAAIAVWSLATRIKLDVDGIGTIPIKLNDSLQASEFLQIFAKMAAGGKVHRAEPLPTVPGSSGPPYALVQWTLENAAALGSLLQEGNQLITRGSVVLIQGTTDLFISLATHGEHESWSSSMTVVGNAAEPQLTQLVEGTILAQPRHTFIHPDYLTMMSMLDAPLECHIREVALEDVSLQHEL